MLPRFVAERRDMLFDQKDVEKRARAAACFLGNVFLEKRARAGRGKTGFSLVAERRGALYGGNTFDADDFAGAKKYRGGKACLVEL